MSRLKTDRRARAVLALVVCLAAMPARSQGQQEQPGAARFFPARDLMRVGVYYYPEHWPESQWARDFANIERMGFEFVHMAEFAWSQMEPEEGRFDFGWLDRAVALAARHKLKIILCTPTPIPPAWFAEKYPQAYLVGADGRLREHGSRGNNALADPDYLRLSERVITEMARRYGRHPSVWGWQLDNEPIAQPDYSPSAQAAFREWLRARYKTVEVLNREWGAAFWSLRYNNFEQVRAPNPSYLYGVNPHAVLDFRRFTADQTGRFLNWQAGLLRRHVAPAQWITTNYISNIGSADPRRSDQLDFASYTMYPVGGGRGLGEEGFRLGWQHGIAFANAFYKNIRGATGVMELQPGQVNWGRVNPQPQPGAVRMWLWHAFAGGCSFASPYRYRHPLYGSELYHYGVVRTDGVTPSPGGLEYMLLDAGWYSKLPEFGASMDPKADITKTIPEIDLPGLVAYAASRNVGLFVWAHWRLVNDQMDAAFPFYQRLGLKGVKIDFMDSDDQEMVAFYHRTLKKAAEHRLLVNFHGAYKPTGLARTYPNYLTQEGVLGAEYNKWSARATATHNVTLAFTRMLLGPLDYTPGAFRNRTPRDFEIKWEGPQAMTTRAHQLAMYVVYESPFACVSDSPGAYRGQAGADFLKQVPASWDETRAVAGEIGEYVVVARRRGRDWYVGALNNERAREVRVPLSFIGDGDYRLTLYADGARPEDVVTISGDLERGRPDGSSSMTLKLAPAGGAVVALKRTR